MKVDSRLRKENIGRGEWVTLENGMEFQPAQGLDPPMEYVRKLSFSSKGFESNPFAEIFVDGTETHYDEYAQAWRALGFYIDCDAQNYDYYYYDNRDKYKEDNENGNNGNNNNNGNDPENNIGCQRFMLWAAVSSQ